MNVFPNAAKKNLLVGRKGLCVFAHLYVFIWMCFVDFPMGHVMPSIGTMAITSFHWTYQPLPMLSLLSLSLFSISVCIAHYTLFEIVYSALPQYIPYYFRIFRYQPNNLISSENMYNTKIPVNVDDDLSFGSPGTLYGYYRKLPFTLTTLSHCTTGCAEI